MYFQVISLKGPLARLALLVALLLLAAWVVNPHLSHGHEAPAPIPVYRVETSQKLMALTVNVVWGTEYVPQLLSVLHSNHVVATFMLGGAWARAHPDLVKEMQQQGDELGNHGWNHQHPNQMSFQGNVDDIQRTNRQIEAIAGVVPGVYAPPYGEFNRTVLQAAQAAHMTLVMWTIDTIDWRPSSSPDYMVKKVLSKSAPGSLVLMHPTNRTVSAFPRIIAGLTQQGYQLVTVSQLLNAGVPKTDS